MGPSEGLAELRVWQADIVVADDISLDPHALSDAVDRLFLCRDQLFVLLPVGHRLKNEPAIELTQLRDERWTLRRRLQRLLQGDPPSLPRYRFRTRHQWFQR